MEDLTISKFTAFEYQIPPPVKCSANYLYPSSTAPRTIQQPNLRQWDQLQRPAALKLTDAVDQLQVARGGRVHASKKKQVWLETQWADLERAEEALKSNFQRFNEFVCENSEKGERAQNQMKANRLTREQLDHKITTLVVNNQKMERTRKLMLQEIQTYSIYEDYLHRVIEQHGEFKSIRAILDRYESYVAAKVDLVIKQEKDMVNLEHARSYMIKFLERTSLVVMGLRNHLASIQDRYKNAKFNSNKWELIVNELYGNAQDKMREVYATKLVIWNTYSLMCKRRKRIPKLQQDDVENQLIFIKKKLYHLIQINKALKKNALKSKTIFISNQK